MLILNLFNMLESYVQYVMYIFIHVKNVHMYIFRATTDCDPIYAMLSVRTVLTHWLRIWAGTKKKGC